MANLHIFWDLDFAADFGDHRRAFRGVARGAVGLQIRANQLGFNTTTNIPFRENIFMV